MAGNPGEVVMIDSEAFMGIRERAAVIVVRTTQDLRHQEHLVSLESSNVDPFKIRGKLRVAEHPLIEVVYDSAHGRTPANGVVVADRSSNGLITHFVEDPSEKRTVAEKLHTTYRPPMESAERSISAPERFAPSHRTQRAQRAWHRVSGWPQALYGHADHDREYNQAGADRGR